MYAEFALENELISTATYYVLEGGFKGCQGLIDAGVWPVALEYCQLLVTSILGVPTDPNFNVYDIREKCEHPPMCYDMSAAATFLNSPKVQEALGVSGRKWVDCNMEVHTALLGDWTTNMASKVSAVLEKGIQVLVYSGDKDFICNWRGGEAWTNAVTWTGQEDFNKQEYSDWDVKGVPAGALKSYKNLKFLRVFNAGHMVPMNQPQNALAMLQDFIMNEIGSTEADD